MYSIYMVIGYYYPNPPHFYSVPRRPRAAHRQSDPLDVPRWLGTVLYRVFGRGRRTSWPHPREGVFREQGGPCQRVVGEEGRMGVDTVAGVVKGLLSLCKSKTKSVGNLIWVPDRSEIARCL